MVNAIHRSRIMRDVLEAKAAASKDPFNYPLRAGLWECPVCGARGVYEWRIGPPPQPWQHCGSTDGGYTPPFVRWLAGHPHLRARESV